MIYYLNISLLHLNAIHLLHVILWCTYDYIKYNKQLQFIVPNKTFLYILVMLEGWQGWWTSGVYRPIFSQFQWGTGQCLTCVIICSCTRKSFISGHI